MRRVSLRVGIWSLLLTLHPLALLAVEGRVTTAAGVPVEHARIEHLESGQVVYTDPDGVFALPEAVPPARLAVSHPRFQQREVAVEAAAPVEVVLDPKQLVFEEIAVSANRGEEHFAPVSIAASVLDPGDAVAPPSTLTELVSGLPGVAESGQGGIFQTYSIRGVARQRVLTLVSGMRIVGERRAGVSASFVDPLLTGRVELLRGPSSTYYGSGALGGVVQLFPRRFDGPQAGVGYDGRGDERHAMAGWGGGGWSAGIVHRRAGNAESAEGQELNSGFEQTSFSLIRDWESGGRRWQLEALGAAGRDIAKANTDFPERTTVYPREGHLLLRLGLRAESGWQLDAWAHPNELRTRVVSRDEGSSEVDNRAFDFGLNWQRRLRTGRAVTARLGFDWFGRRGVEARERTFEPGPAGGAASLELRTLDGAEEDEVGVYGALEWNVRSVVILGGGRLAWQRQENAGAGSVDDAALTGFAGLVAPLGGGFELVANLGSGLRFPSLSERFFSGTTGRGEVEANPALGPERSLDLDGGLRWYGSKLFLSGHLFYKRIDEYIERLEIAPDLLTFRNLTDGTLKGLELEGLYRIGGRWSCSFGGHLMEGREGGGAPLADVPADRLYAGARRAVERWSWEGRWEARAAKRDPGSGEKEIPSADLVSMSLRVAARPGLWIELSGRNLLNEEYFNSADRKITPAPGRSFALSLLWRPEP